MNDNITKLNMVIETLESDIEERKNLNLLAKKAIADTKKKIRALEKLEAKEREILGDLYEDLTCDEEPEYHRPYVDINRTCGDDCGCNESECRQSDIPVID